MDTMLILIRVNLPGLFEQFSTIATGVPDKSKCRLGAKRYWRFRKPGQTVPMAAMVPALIPPIKWFIKFTIGDGCCVGGNGSVVHTEIV